MPNYFLILLLLVPGPSSGKRIFLVPGSIQSLDFLYVDQSVESNLLMHEPRNLLRSIPLHIIQWSLAPLFAFSGRQSLKIPVSDQDSVGISIVPGAQFRKK